MIKIFDRFLNTLERRFGSLATPGLIRYFAVSFFGVYLMSSVMPELGAQLDFNWAKIMTGEVWRVFTFIFSASAGGELNPIGILFAFFGMMLMFIFGDGLEQQWGVFRANLYVLWGWLTALLGSIAVQSFTGHAPAMPGIYLGASILFAFATYNPRYSIMLFMVIPTPIWIIAAFSGVLMALSALSGGLLLMIFTVFCLSNYLVVAIPMRYSKARLQQGNVKRRKNFKAESLDETLAFNNCVVCGATEISHPDTDFRVGEDGKDYCQEHLPE